MKKNKQKASDFSWWQPLLGVALLLSLPAHATHRVLQFENDYVKVWKTIILPGEPLNMHRHDHARVVVGLKGGSLTKIEQTGETSELIFESGKAYWLEEDPLGTLHADINESESPIEVMVIEFSSICAPKQD